MSRLGKCHNYSGCLLAYRGEQTEVPDGQPFVCAECGKPLTEVKTSPVKADRDDGTALRSSRRGDRRFAMWPKISDMLQKKKTARPDKPAAVTPEQAGRDAAAKS